MQRRNLLMVHRLRNLLFDRIVTTIRTDGESVEVEQTQPVERSAPRYTVEQAERLRRAWDELQRLMPHVWRVESEP
jgi:hypothetical protein